MYCECFDCCKTFHLTLPSGVTEELWKQINAHHIDTSGATIRVLCFQCTSSRLAAIQDRVHSLMDVEESAKNLAVVVLRFLVMKFPIIPRPHIYRIEDTDRVQAEWTTDEYHFEVQFNADWTVKLTITQVGPNVTMEDEEFETTFDWKYFSNHLGMDMRFVTPQATYR